MTRRKPIDQRLSFLLQSRNLTQRQLALAVNASPAAVHTWLKNTKLPSAEMVERIAEYLGVSSKYLYGEEDLPVKVRTIKTISGGRMNVTISEEPAKFFFMQKRMPRNIELLNILQTDLKFMGQPVNQLQKQKILQAVMEIMSEQ